MTTELELRQANERFQLAASAVDCIIFDWSIETQTVDRTQGLLDVLGYRPEEAEPTLNWWTQRIHPDDRQRVYKEVSDAVANRSDFATEYRVRHKNNQYLYVWDKGLIVRNGMGKAVRVVGSTLNITDRKQAEIARQEHEQRLSAIATNIPGTVYRSVLHPDGTTSLPYISAGLRELTGLEPDEVIAEPERLLTIVHPDDREKFDRVLRARYETIESVQNEYRIVTLSGQVKWLQDNARCFRMDNGDVVLDGVTLDITERKRAEEALQQLNQELENRVRERTIELEQLNEILIVEIDQRTRAEASLRQREQEFRALVENAPDIITRFDRELRHIYVNPAVELATGIPARDFIGKTNQELGMPSELVAYWCQTLQVVFETGSEQEIEFTFPTPNGLKYYQSRHVPEFGADGSTETVLAIARDITMLKQAEAAIRSSEERFRQLAENIYEVFWISSVDHAQIIYVSPAYEQIWGRSCENLYEQPSSWLEAIHPEDRDRVEAALKRQIQGDYDVEYRIVQPDNSIRWIRDRAFPVQDAQGQVYRLAGIAEDITSRKQVEEELYHTLQKERELRELKSRFISMTSHEFRTPLTTIQSSADLLERYRQRFSQEKQLTHLYRIQTAVERMIQMLNDILILGQAEAGKLEFDPTSVDLVQFCRNLVEDLQLAANPKNAVSEAMLEERIRFTCQCQSLPASIDEKLLRQILSNLLSNAIKYSPSGSTVQFNLTYVNDNAVFQIQDQGIGIPPEDQPHLFNSFHRAKNVGTIQGTGLGLAIVKQCVDLHGGEISLKSEIGKGTTFTVTLPLNTQM
jgi:PAS domain S-box-containing protein